MSADHWRKELLRDIQRAVSAQRIVYLEGKTDIDVFAALIGQPLAKDDLYDGVVVRGLRASKGGSGSNTLELVLQVAQEIGLADRVTIIRDGDGQALEQLSASFEGDGPLYHWPTYCIENLLAQVDAGWPDGWGERPEWAEVLGGYTAYVALNMVHSTLQHSLQTLALATFTNPAAARPLLDVDQILERLERDKALVAGFDVAAAFSDAVRTFTVALQDATLAQAHAMFNGKWLVHDFARRRTNLSQEECRSQWCDAVRAAGGHPEVKAWWARIKQR